MESMFQQAAKAAPQTPDQSTAPAVEPQTVASPAPSGTSTPMSAMFEQAAQQQAAANATKQEVSPRESGEITNDVGNRVIVPKDGETFDQTMKRAAASGQTVTQDQLNREERTIPAKAATVIATAPVLGAAGTASGAAVNEVATALPSVIPHTIAGVKAIGAWANANPIQAYLLYNVLKELVPGAKKAMGVIKGVPEVE